MFWGGHILILITDFYVLLFLKLCKQDVMVQPFVFVCKPSKMMFNSGFHKSILKAKQIKKASLLACLVFFLSLFLVFVFLQEVNMVITLAEQTKSLQLESRLKIIMKHRCGHVSQSLVLVEMLSFPLDGVRKMHTWSNKKFSQVILRGYIL